MGEGLGEEGEGRGKDYYSTHLTDEDTEALLKDSSPDSLRSKLVMVTSALTTLLRAMPCGYFVLFPLSGRQVSTASQEKSWKLPCLCIEWIIKTQITS